jgi:hypothetical protein
MNRRITKDIDQLSLPRTVRVGRIIADTAFVVGMFALAWVMLAGTP